MNKEKIVNYIKQNNWAEIADIQQKFEIPYKDVKALICELVADGTLAFDSGVRYIYVQKGDKLDDRRAELEKRRAEAIRKVHENLSGADEKDDDAEEKAQAERRAYLEMRRQELIKRMQAEMEDDDDDEDDESDDIDNDDEESEERIDDETLRLNALKLIIEKGKVSVSMFQRTFPIGYIASCKLVEWMESMGYISEPEGESKTRRVLITEEEYNKLCNESSEVKIEFEDEYDFDEDDFDEDDSDIDARFAEYEKFLKEHMDDFDEDEEDDEDETYDGIIKRIFHSDAEEMNIPNDESEEHKTETQKLVTVLNKLTDKKKAQINADSIPDHSAWDNDDEFGKVVMERLERLIKSDKRMGQQGAVKKAETYLEAVRDTHDRKMVQVYERLVYEIKNTSNYLYGQLKKQFFGE